MKGAENSPEGIETIEEADEDVIEWAHYLNCIIYTVPIFFVSALPSVVQY